MTTPAKVEIVFRRKVRAIWLEQGMALAELGRSWAEAKPVLAKEIAADNAGIETIRKVLEHVRRIWFAPPENCSALRSAALTLLRTCKLPATRTLLNWGMAIAAYPFLGSVAEALGRLLRLQQEAHRIDIQRRLRAQHGDREFVSRITRYDVSSFLDWGVIIETKKPGVYQLAKPIHLHNGEQLAWLAEAVLISRAKTQMIPSEFSHHPCLFPFNLDSLNASDLNSNPRLKLLRQNLNEEYMILNH